MKLTNILKEIRIKSLNNDGVSDNESLVRFLNNNISEFIEHEEIISAFMIDEEIANRLRLHYKNSEEHGGEIVWKDPTLDYNLPFHYFYGKEENLPDPGSAEWVPMFFKGIHFWKLDYSDDIDE